MEKTLLSKKIKFALYIACIFAFSSFPVLAGIIVEPNGVISHGTTLTVRIDLPKKEKTVNLEIVKDENRDGKGESKEKRLLVKTPITDGLRTGKLKDFDSSNGVIEIHMRITSIMEPGTYIIRCIPGPGRLPEGVTIEIVRRSSDFLSWFKSYVIDLKEVINDPAPILGLVRDKTKPERIRNTDLWLMDGHTFKIISRLTNSKDCRSPRWSPDGKRVAYIRWVNNKGQLWIFTIGKEGGVSKTARLAANIPGNILNPMWSHDGKKIAFLLGNELWIVNANGSKANKITSMDGMRKILTWTRDDQYIIFSSIPSNDMPVLTKDGKLLRMDNLEIIPEDREILNNWIIDIRKGKQKRLLNDLCWLWMRYISPDGAKLVFPVKMSEKGNELWLRQGENFNDTKRLTEGNYIDIEPSCSPDGRWIIFVSNRNL